MREGKVVVIVPLVVLQNNVDGTFAARFRELGLTAYGDARDIAEFRLRRLFNKFVKEYRKLGRLENKLRELGAQWHWIEDYHESYEDMDELFSQNDTWFDSSMRVSNARELELAA